MLRDSSRLSFPPPRLPACYFLASKKRRARDPFPLPLARQRKRTTATIISITNREKQGAEQRIHVLVLLQKQKSQQRRWGMEPADEGDAATAGAASGVRVPPPRPKAPGHRRPPTRQRHCLHPSVVPRPPAPYYT